MLSFLPAPILFIINLIELTIVTILVACPMLIIALFKWIPSKIIGNMINAVNQTCFKIWISNNAFLMRLTNKIEWDIQGLENTEPVKGSCIIISNHLSWTDIVMLGHVYKGKIPITKFFLKHSLIYIPVIGLVCYAIGMPFLRRYSREQLLRNPKLKNKDIATTRKACRSLLDYPSSLINFVEGTRYTPEKAEAQKSPYRNLMPPKAASLAVALGIIGKNIDCLFNTTLLYPHTEGNVFFALLCGRLKKVVARVEKVDNLDTWIGDYIGNKQFKHQFTQNLRQLWQQKDEQLTAIKQKEGLLPADLEQLTAKDVTYAQEQSPAQSNTESTIESSSESLTQTKIEQETSLDAIEINDSVNTTKATPQAETSATTETMAKESTDVKAVETESPAKASKTA